MRQQTQESAAPARDRRTSPPGIGQRVFTAGHSFHVFIAPLLQDIARSAGITGHRVVGTQFLGGSRVIQHWERPDCANDAKRALRTGGVDVLTLSPTVHPDPGIDAFTRLALAHNPDVRVTVQASWVPFDGLLLANLHPGKAGRDALTGDDLHRLHALYFPTVDAEVAALNQVHGRPVLSVVPVGQALIALRARIRAGQAPGLRSQEELFTDPVGHPTVPVQVLAAYSHFAVVYRRNPVGLDAPAALGRWGSPRPLKALNHLLQELAWEAVVRHPLSGVTESA